MSKPIKRAALLVLAVSTAAVLWNSSGDSEEVDTARAEHLANRIWLERMPQGSRDMVWNFVAVDHERAKVGVVGRSSNWRFFGEAFKWRLRGDKLGFYFPQQDRRARVPVRTWECKGEAPAPFELCLQFGTGDRSHVFYSRRKWKVRPHEDGFVADADDEVAVPSVVLAGLGFDAPDVEVELDGEDVDQSDWLPGEALPR